MGSKTGKKRKVQAGKKGKYVAKKTKIINK